MEIFDERFIDIKQLKERLNEIDLNTDDWEIDISNMQDEGRGYTFKGKSYEEVSDVLLINKKNLDDNILLWISYAHPKESKIVPILFIWTIDNLNENLIKKYNIKPLPSPDIIISKFLDAKQSKKLFEQEYFKDGTYKKAWKRIIEHFKNLWKKENQ